MNPNNFNFLLKRVKNFLLVELNFAFQVATPYNYSIKSIIFMLNSSGATLFLLSTILFQNPFSKSVYKMPLYKNLFIFQIILLKFIFLVSFLHYKS